MKSPANLEALIIVALFIVPGYLGTMAFGHFIVRQQRVLGRAVVESIAASLLFWVCAAPFVSQALVSGAFESDPFWAVVKLSTAALVVPSIAGLVLGKMVEDSDTRWLRMAPPRAWDFRFGKRTPLLVLVTLTDGSKVGGLWAGDSCAAIYPEAEDLYLETVFELHETGHFGSPVRGSAGTWIPSNSIRLIQFFNFSEDENTA